MLEITGKLVNTIRTQEGDSARGHWIKGGFVIEVGEQYPKNIAFTLFGQEKLNMLANLQMGMFVTVKFDIESREYNGRYYTDAKCTNVYPTSQPQPQATQQQPTPAQQPRTAPNTQFTQQQQSAQMPKATVETSDSDLPF